MPKVSSAPEDALHFKGSYADGWGEVVDAKAVVFQYPPDKSTGRQDTPSLFCELTIQRYREPETKDATAPESIMLSIQRSDKMTGELSLVHPGKYPNGNLEADPEDMSGGLGAEGDTLFALQDGYQINDKTKWMRFTQSLVEKGFKPAVLKRTYFPDLVGLRAYFTNLTEKKFRDDQTSDPTVFVVKEIRQFPYEKKAVAKGKPAAAEKKTAAAAAAAAAKPVNGAPTPSTLSAPEETADGIGGGSAAAEDIAFDIVKNTLAPAKKGTTIASPGDPQAGINRLKIEAYLAINRHKPAVPAALKKAVQEKLGDTTWLEAIGAVNELFSLGEDGSVTFQ
jgi:hypothetical protein